MNVLELEARGCFDFIWNEANTNPISPGFGLIVDTTKRPGRASIASVGFGLAGVVVGVNRGYVSYEEAKTRVLGTMKTLRDHVSHVNGFFAHFVDMETGKRFERSEYSTIDTAILLMGAITVGEFFGGEIKEIADTLLNRTKWEWLIRDHNGKPVFSMAYNPERFPERDGWSKASWHLYAEQLMMYFLAAGQEGFDHDLALKLYFGFERRVGSYKSLPFVYMFGGSLFVYQFTHAFIDFRNTVDAHGFDWFYNSVQATIANRNFCIDKQIEFKTYHEKAWGLTASDGPFGYKAYGALPCGWENLHYESLHDGTVMPCGPAGSIPFLPEESMASLQYFYLHHPQLWGKYGFKDAYNLDVNPPWYADSYIGIDKGISLLMIDNYENGTTWKLMSQSETIKRAFEVLQFNNK